MFFKKNKMKLSTLILHYFKESDFTSLQTLADSAGVSISPVKAAIKGRASMEKIDKIFEAVAPVDFTLEDFLFAMEHVEYVKSKEWQKEHML